MHWRRPKGGLGGTAPKFRWGDKVYFIPPIIENYVIKMIKKYVKGMSNLNAKVDVTKTTPRLRTYTAVSIKRCQGKY